MNINRNARKNAERLRQPNIITTVRTEEQKGYGGACKVGYDLGESPYVCFLNSDCKIEDANWLRSLGECLIGLKSQGIRMVSPVMNNPVHGDPAQKGDKFNKEDPVIVADDSFLSLPCFLCHRELFNHVGGFLKEYKYGGYEDEEFAARLKKHGFKQAVCKKSYVHHKGESTIRALWKTDLVIKKVMEEENRKLCIEDIKRLK